MAFDHYIYSAGKRLRCGYTTGTCAALASAGAAALLLSGEAPRTLSLTTPKGFAVELAPAWCRMEGAAALCAVRKDAGDDPDVTDGLLIAARAERAGGEGIQIDGGSGVGRVTRPGLEQPVGAAAINRVPREMIAEAVQTVCRTLDYPGGLKITILVPDGAELAQKTFNPNLGIVGGISILGTTGVVEPMSLQALADTIRLELGQAAAAGARDVLLTPGAYGASFLRAHGLLNCGIPVVKCSNLIGEGLDAAGEHGFQRVLLVGHAGKLVKLAGGIMNTHSRWADCRAELFCAHAALAGAGQPLCARLMEAATTDACLELLDSGGLRDTVLNSLLDAVQHHLERRAAGAYQVGATMFSNQYGLLGVTKQAREILSIWNKEREFFTP